MITADKYSTRQEALRATFADSIIGETICVHRDRPDVDHKNVFSCPCEPIFIEIWPEMTMTHFLQIADEETGH